MRVVLTTLDIGRMKRQHSVSLRFRQGKVGFSQINFPIENKEGEGKSESRQEYTNTCTHTYTRTHMHINKITKNPVSEFLLAWI